MCDPSSRHTVLETNTQPTRRPQQGATRAPAPQPGQAGAQARPQPPHGFGNALRGLLGFPAPPAAQPPPPLIPAGIHPFGHAGGQVPQNLWGQYPPPGYQPQQLQAPPVFHGFYGPGGVWQPWPLAAPGQAAAQPPANTSNPQAGPSTSTPNPAHTSSAPPDPTHDSTPAPRSTSPPTATIPRDRADEDASDPSNPREAAAAAALRRFGSGSKAPERNDSQSPHDQVARPIPTAITNSPSAPPARTSTSPNGFAQRPNVPSLIPVSYLPSTLTATAGMGQHRPSSSTLRNYNDDNFTSSPLPPTLTDEQLSRMDTLTREAIDERLRLLENVSSTVHRCIEDLTRVRSVLPASSATGNGSLWGNGSTPETKSASETNETGTSSSARATEKRPEREAVMVGVSSEEEEEG